MPDQHTAATEHALLQEVAEPLSTLPGDAVAVAAQADFPVVMRGYDRGMVDAYVERTTRLVAELQSTRSPEAAVRRALERVGEEVSGILQRAHETAERITSQSRAEAEERLQVARREAAEFTAGAEVRVKDLDAETDRIWAERRRIVDDVHELAGKLTGLAESAIERFPEAEEDPAPVAEDESAAVAGEAEVFDAEAAEREDEVVDERSTNAPESGQGRAPDADADADADADGETTQVLRWDRPSISERQDHDH
ncbi:MAG TPA: hypothetical protein VNR66_05485 [Solirubrobacteraceae bacterium]|nr:hypothetical protein [Solirubrobacteraceae bacterium]